MADTQNGIANNEEEIGTDNEEESVEIESIENQNYNVEFYFGSWPGCAINCI